MEKYELIIIPSSLLVDAGMIPEIGPIPSCMVSLGNKPILFHLINHYRTVLKNFKICIVGYEGIEYIELFLKNFNLTNIAKLVKLDKLKDLGYTIYYGLNKFDDLSNVSRIIVNFGDTLILEKKIPSDNFIIYQELEEIYRWTTFEINQAGNNIEHIIEKSQAKKSPFKKVFVGEFGFSDVNSVIRCFDQILTESKDHLDSFYRMLLLYSKNHEYIFLNTKNWLDAGHIDTYYLAKRNFINARFFNSLEITNKGSIIKKSDDQLKFVNEIQWYLKLPNSLQYYVPKIYSFSIDFVNPYIEMEYYGFSSLTELFLSAQYEIGIWNKIFDILFCIHNEFCSYKYIEKNVIEDSVKKMYIDKTITRLQKFQNNSTCTIDFYQQFKINNIEYSSLKTILENLESKLISFNILSPNEFNIVHGDFCLSNILYDVRNRFIKLIDPRGNFGINGVYGDHRYDLAKLSHSLLGGYDYIVNDQFRLEYNQNEINYQFFKTKKQIEIIENFERKLNEHYSTIIHQIRMIEALLFLSMVPLHADQPSHQILMLARGIEILSGIENKHN